MKKYPKVIDDPEMARLMAIVTKLENLAGDRLGQYKCIREFVDKVRAEVSYETSMWEFTAK